MQTLIDLSIKLGLFYVFIALGFLVARYYNKQKQLNKYVTFVLINILLPILIIDTVMTAPSDILIELPMIVAFTILMHVLGFGLMYLRLQKSGIEKKTKGSMLLTTTFPNGIFLPVPLILLFIGESGIAVVAIFSVTQMILLAIVGTMIGSAYSDDEIGHKSMLRKVLLFPPFLAVVLGLILSVIGFSVPIELDLAISYNGVAATYLALFVVGLGLGTKVVYDKLRLAIESISIRQLIVPVVVGVLLLFAGLSDITSRVILLEAMMPAAVITAIFAGSFKLDSETASTIVTIGTLCLLPIVPFMPFLFGMP
ncbi:MAG: AEC family transporter [Candidatus Thorarchaeota archaeon]